MIWSVGRRKSWDKVENFVILRRFKRYFKR